VVYQYGGLLVSLSVGLSVTLVSPCKNGCTDRDTVWVEDSGRPRNHVLDRGPDPHGKGQFEGKGASHCKV